jgi:hypothetical protein
MAHAYALLLEAEPLLLGANKGDDGLETGATETVACSALGFFAYGVLGSARPPGVNSRAMMICSEFDLDAG